MEIGIVKQVDIEHQMKTAYLDYAMSVITSRALPDVRDGLKPVQRRILYAMDDMGLQHDKLHKKSARIVGEVLGKYHPHGDTAVYDAMARMAQDFSMRYPLVDGQGNFGSIDGDNPAAMRYTEARLSALASELLADIDKDTVDFMDNFDGSLREPAVLPARLPNLLLNGVSGIAVGMATNVPPHNLAELCDALILLIDKYRRIDAVSVDELMQFVQGPDFPTGGTILGLEGIRSAFATGKGSISVRAKAHFEDAGGGKSLIVVTELPYQVSKSGLIEKIAELVRDKRVDTLSDLRDESDRQGMRIVIQLKRGVEPQPTLAQLFKYTQMQGNFNVNMIALVDGEPRVLSLKRSLQLFIEHRLEVITRRSRFERERAKYRAHIVEGLLTALDHLDEVIDTIRRSRTADTALTNLMHKFKLTELQARAILDLQLRRLAALERRRIEEEHAGLLKRIKELEGLLRSRRRIFGLIKAELRDLKARYGDARRTRISDKADVEVSAEDLIPEQDVYLAITRRGYIKKMSRRSDPLAGSRDPTRCLVATNTLHSVILCTNRGRCFTTKVHLIPDSQAPGMPLPNVLTMDEDETVTALVEVPDFEQGGFLTVCTALGQIKRTAISEFAGVRTTGLHAINLAKDDELRWAKFTDGHQQVILITAKAQALRFKEADVRPTGRSAGGVYGIKLASGDHLILMDVVEEAGSLLVMSEKGFGKRSPLGEYPLQNRNGKGVTTFSRMSLQTGQLAASSVLGEEDGVAVVTAGGRTLRMMANEISQQGRATRGTRVVQLAAKDSVAAVVRRPAKQNKGRSRSRASAKKPTPTSHPQTRKTSAAGTRSTRARRTGSAPKSESSSARSTGSRTRTKG